MGKVSNILVRFLVVTALAKAQSMTAWAGRRLRIQGHLEPCWSVVAGRACRNDSKGPGDLRDGSVRPGWD